MAVVTVNEQSVHMIVALLCMAFQLGGDSVLRVARSRSILGGPWMVFQLVCNGVFRVARSRSILGGPSLFFDYVCHFSW